MRGFDLDKETSALYRNIFRWRYSEDLALKVLMLCFMKSLSAHPNPAGERRSLIYPTIRNLGGGEVGVKRGNKRWQWEQAPMVHGCRRITN